MVKVEGGGSGDMGKKMKLMEFGSFERIHSALMKAEIEILLKY